MKFETKAIHAGQESDPSTGAVIVPVFQTSTYQQEAIGKHKGYEYSRTGNPTRTALETCLAELEGGRYGLAFSSGLAATTAVFSLFGQATHIVLGDDLYGGTYRLMEKVFRQVGNLGDLRRRGRPESLSRSPSRPNTRLIWIESPTNPLLKVIDIQRLRGNCPRRSTCSWRWTIPSPVPISRTRSRGRILSCTAQPNTSTVTVTSWAGPWW